MSTRDSFIFYKSFYEALAELPDGDRLSVMDHLLKYQFTGNEDVLSGIPKAIFSLIKPQLDANNKRYDNGRKGGRPPKETKQKPKDNQTVTKPKANKNVNVNNNVNDITPLNPPRVGLDDLSVSHIQDWLTQKRVNGKYLLHDEHFILEKFKDYCRSKGKKYADYPAALRNAFDWESLQPPRHFETNGASGPGQPSKGKQFLDAGEALIAKRAAARAHQGQPESAGPTHETIIADLRPVEKIR